MATAEDGELYAWNVAYWELGPQGLGTVGLGLPWPAPRAPSWPVDERVGESYRHEGLGATDRGLLHWGAAGDTRDRATTEGMGFGNHRRSGQQSDLQKSPAGPGHEEDCPHLITPLQFRSSSGSLNPASIS